MKLDNRPEWNFRAAFPISIAVTARIFLVRAPNTTSRMTSDIGNIVGLILCIESLDLARCHVPQSIFTIERFFCVEFGFLFDHVSSVNVSPLNWMEIGLRCELAYQVLCCIVLDWHVLLSIHLLKICYQFLAFEWSCWHGIGRTPPKKHRVQILLGIFFCGCFKAESRRKPVRNS